MAGTAAAQASKAAATIARERRCIPMSVSFQSLCRHPIRSISSVWPDSNSFSFFRTVSLIAIGPDAEIDAGGRHFRGWQALREPENRSGQAIGMVQAQPYTGTPRGGVDADSMPRPPALLERHGPSLDPPAAVTVSVARAPTIAGFA